jgi:hypothetical protein
MIISRTVLFRSFSLLLLAATLTGCATIAQFDQQAYNNAVETKVKALLLMNKATTPYEQNIAEIDNLRYSLNYGYEYARGIAKNENSVKQWEIMKAPDSNLLGGFLKRWEEKKMLKPAFISDAKPMISEGFDAIIELENGKIKFLEAK